MYFGLWLQTRLVEIDIQLLFAKRSSLFLVFHEQSFRV